MKLTMYPYRDEDDYWHIRQFLREVFLCNDRHEVSWPVYRFDYWRWHVLANIEKFRLEEVVFIWRADDGQIVAVLNPEGKGEVFLHVHPHWRTAELEQEMLSVAEEQLAVITAEGHRQLRVWAPQADAIRQDVLRQAGYVKEGAPEYQRRRSMALPIPNVAPTPGYAVRALGDGAELIERCYASGLAFHPNEIRYAVENRDVRWYRNIQNAPLYRRDLDLVVIAADGSVASFGTIWFDDTTRTGAFEPVGTVPAQQRRGLGRMVLAEGLRRLKQMGATMAYIGSYSPAAHALYAAMGFTDYHLSEPWTKEW